MLFGQFGVAPLFILQVHLLLLSFVGHWDMYTREAVIFKSVTLDVGYFWCPLLPWLQDWNVFEHCVLSDPAKFLIMKI